MEADPVFIELCPAPPRSGAGASRLAGTALAALLVAFASSAWPAAGEEKPAAQPTPTPAPKPSPTPRTTPEPKTTVQAKPAVPAAKPKTSGTPEPALSFTDFDLEKFHKAAPPAEEPSEDDEVATAPPVGPAASVPPGAPAGPPAQAPPGAPAKAPGARATGARGPTAKRPAPPPQTTEDDPLRPFRDREAKEKFRTQQIQGLRDRLAKIQVRLDYLEGKRRAILDPLSIMPKPPEGADTRGEGSMRPKELLEKVDEEIKALKEEQEEAQAQLASVETRFAQESQSR